MEPDAKRSRGGAGGKPPEAGCENGTSRKPGGIGSGARWRVCARHRARRAFCEHSKRTRFRFAPISGVSSGAIVAAAIASGATSDEIEKVALSMKFRDVARWTLNHYGAGRQRSNDHVSGALLKADRFEDMRIPLAIVATDLITGKPVTFHGNGDVDAADSRQLRVSRACFSPIRYQGRLLVDGFVAWRCPPSRCCNWALTASFR